MGFCTSDGDAADMAKTASDLYVPAKSGDNDARLNLLYVMQGINNNHECSGHDEYVKDVFDHLTGPLRSDAIMSTGQRPGYPNLSEEQTVSEIHIPPLAQLMNPKSK